MAYVKLIIVLLAVYLFVRFVGLMLLLASRVLRPSGSTPSHSTRLGPDDVDPIPVIDVGGFGYSRQMGRDRFGRMVFEIREGRGDPLYVYFDREASEAARLERAANVEISTMEPDEDSQVTTRLALGWKGFTADSSPRDVLGVARDASIAQIKAAYRKLITKYHPDRYSNLSATEIEQLESDSKLINAAYAELLKTA